MLGGGTVRHVNLDVAASAPALDAVAAHVARVLPYYASVHRGSGYPSQATTALVEDARATVARHVGARDDHLVVFTRDPTDALNLLASAVPGETKPFDVIVPRREVSVADGPVDRHAVLGVGLEIQVAPAIGLPSPK